MTFIEGLFCTQTVHLGPGFLAVISQLAFIQEWPLRGVPLLCTLALPRVGESLSGGCSVFVGMSSGPGDLLAVYEWTLQCKALRKAESKRIKQVHCIL